MVEATKDAERYLGYRLDPVLSFEQHRKKMVTKGSNSLYALRSLSGST